MRVGSPRVQIACSIAILSLGCSGSQATPQSAPVATPQTTPPPVTAEPVAAAAADPAPAPAIVKEPFGKVDGRDVERYTLRNARGSSLKVMTYGAIITELNVPDKAGKFADVVLGFDNLDAYVAGNPYFGATVGRVANRIRGAKFKLGGKEYALAENDKPHHLHGGKKGWDKVVWSAETAEKPDAVSIRFTHVSKDGEEGYPGTVTAKVTYTLTADDTLRVEMEAVTDKTTIVNMVHHSYWNLGGHGSGSIADHELTLFADRYTPGDPMVPTGALRPVKGTPFDFTQPKPIGKDLALAGGKPNGFDHNYVVDGEANVMRRVAKLRDPKSGRVLTLEGNQPGVQFYSGNFLDGTSIGKGGVAYQQHAGLCLETQKFPNAINVPAWKEQVILEPGQTYRHEMIHRFTAE